MVSLKYAVNWSVNLLEDPSMKFVVSLQNLLNKMYLLEKNNWKSQLYWLVLNKIKNWCEFWSDLLSLLYILAFLVSFEVN